MLAGEFSGRSCSSTSSSSTSSSTDLHLHYVSEHSKFTRRAAANVNCQPLHMSIQSYYLGSGFEPGKPLQGGCVAQVVASKAPGFAEGEVVSGMLPWSSHQIVEADAQVGAEGFCGGAPVACCWELQLQAL